MRLTLLLLCTLAPAAALAQAPAQDPDWPCQQRLVPELTPATYWNGTLPATGDWHADPRVAKLVGEVAPRDVPTDEADKKLTAFAAALKAGERATLLPEAFVGIVEQAGAERSQVIDRLHELTRRQRNIADLATKADADVAAIPAASTGDAADRRAEAQQRKDMLTRTFEQTRQTMRFACEVPGQIDSRLGEFARVLQSHQ